MSRKRKYVKDSYARKVAMMKKRGTWTASEESTEETAEVDSSVALLLKERELNKDVEFVWKDAFNYHPGHPGIWVKYNLWRYKERHDVRLHDGTVYRGMYPNGNGWHGEVRVDDTDVAEIRLCRPEETRYASIEWYVEHAISLFGEDHLPEVQTAPVSGDITFIPKRYRYYEKGVLDANGEYTCRLMEGELTLGEFQTSGKPTQSANTEGQQTHI